MKILSQHRPQASCKSCGVHEGQHNSIWAPKWSGGHWAGPQENMENSELNRKSEGIW